jgi:hypothetical protein
MERNYEKALQETEQILFLDPNNAAGLLLRDVLTDTILMQQYEDASDQRRPSYVRELVNNWKATIAPDEHHQLSVGLEEHQRSVAANPMQFSESAVNSAVLASARRQADPRRLQRQQPR